MQSLSGRMTPASAVRKRERESYGTLTDIQVAAVR